MKYNFPAIVDVGNSLDQIEKIKEEIKEFLTAKTEKNKDEEVIDILHTVETLVRIHFKNRGKVLNKVIDEIIMKNIKRSYYSQIDILQSSYASELSHKVANYPFHTEVIGGRAYELIPLKTGEPISKQVKEIKGIVGYSDLGHVTKNDKDISVLLRDKVSFLFINKKEIDSDGFIKYMNLFWFLNSWWDQEKLIDPNFILPKDFIGDTPCFLRRKTS